WVIRKANARRPAIVIVMELPGQRNRWVESGLGIYLKVLPDSEIHRQLLVNIESVAGIKTECRETDPDDGSARTLGVEGVVPQRESGQTGEGIRSVVAGI